MCALGCVFKSAEKHLTPEDIKCSAAEFDPQPYHLTRLRRSVRRLKDLLPLAGTGRWLCAWHAERKRPEVSPYPYVRNVGVLRAKTRATTPNTPQNSSGFQSDLGPPPCNNRSL